MAPNTHSSRKRRAEQGANGGMPAKRAAMYSPSDVYFRLLVPAGKIGKLIGKQGSQIKLLRDETSAHIKIATPISNTEDRAVLISSKDTRDDVDKTCAEVALLRVASILLEDSDTAPSAAISSQHQGFPNLTRLLISGSQAGCLIGKGGATISDIRETSSANVRILPSDQLPICSAACETDRLVQISGDLSCVQKAIELVAAKLRENPAKESIAPAQARPAYFLGIDGRTGHQLLLPHAALSMYGLPPHPAAFGAIVGQPQLFASSGIMAKVTSEMSIPSALMGGLIGRGGANITHIRSASGAAIKVHGQKEGSIERTISFEGTQEQVTFAKSLVHAFLNGQQ